MWRVVRVEKAHSRMRIRHVAVLCGPEERVHIRERPLPRFAAAPHIAPVCLAARPPLPLYRIGTLVARNAAATRRPVSRLLCVALLQRFAQRRHAPAARRQASLQHKQEGSRRAEGNLGVRQIAVSTPSHASTSLTPMPSRCARCCPPAYPIGWDDNAKLPAGPPPLASPL